MTSIDGGLRPIAPGVALAVGAVAGLASGSLGIGGGLIVVPLLSAWLGVPLKRAVGTSLLAVMVTALVAVLAEALVAPANLRWGIAAVLAACAIAGSWLGARIVAILPVRRLATLMALLLLAAALRMSELIEWVAPGGPGGASAPITSEQGLVAAHALTGLGAGFLASLFGIGGGILAVPALAFLHPDWPFQACRATSLAMIVPTSLVAALLHHRLANVDPRLAAGLLPGCVVGATLGVLLANHVPGRPLEIAFAALLAISAIQLLRRSGPQDSPAPSATAEK